MTILGYADSNIITLFVGIGAIFLVVAGVIFHKTPILDENDSIPSSKADYNRLVENARRSWSIVSKNNKIYLCAFVIGVGVQLAGLISGHPLLENPSIIGMICLMSFVPCLKNLVRGRLLDDQVIGYAITGMIVEKENVGWGVDYFQKFVRDYHHARFGIISLTFFRVIIPSWLIFSAVRLSILQRFTTNLPKWLNVLGEITIFGIACFLLWRVSCQSYRLLRIRGKAILASATGGK